MPIEDEEPTPENTRRLGSISPQTKANGGATSDRKEAPAPDDRDQELDRNIKFADSILRLIRPATVANMVPSVISDAKFHPANC
jgi:hypothetical protein